MSTAFSPLIARQQASRCLYCHDAPCMTACPSQINVPLFIRQIATGNPQGAARTILADNPLGYSCGSTCPTDQLCEGACVLHDTSEPVIPIGALQHYAVGTVLNQPALSAIEPLPPVRHPQQVAIVGAGPAGLSCAIYLRRAGYQATVFEASDQPGGLNRTGIAPYKLTAEQARQETDALIKHYQLAIEYRTRLVSVQQQAAYRAEERLITLPGLLADYEAVLLATGLGQTRWPEALPHACDNILSAVSWIEAAKQANPPDLSGQQIVILGGGNTAMDAAIRAAQLGASSVRLLYRGAEDCLSAYPQEIAKARQAGVMIEPNTSLLSVEQQENLATHLVAKQQDHLVRYPIDQILVAIGQQVDTSFLMDLPELAQPGASLVVDATGRTCHPRLWLGGDYLNGGREVVHAVQSGKLAAQAMIESFYVTQPVCDSPRTLTGVGL